MHNTFGVRPFLNRNSVARLSEGILPVGGFQLLQQVHKIYCCRAIEIVVVVTGCIFLQQNWRLVEGRYGTCGTLNAIRKIKINERI